jgi:hypothetical protein
MTTSDNPMSARRDELMALADRVEALAGPCRRVDARVYIALNPTEQTIIGHKPGRFPQDPIYGPITEFIDMAENSKDARDIANFINAPAFTASFDAAMTLVETGQRRIEFGSYGDGTAWAYVHTLRDRVGESDGAPNEAAAVAAAALRAIAARQEPTA